VSIGPLPIRRVEQRGDRVAAEMPRGAARGGVEEGLAERQIATRGEQERDRVPLIVERRLQLTLPSIPLAAT
jgi:hypothetical protein